MEPHHGANPLETRAYDPPVRQASPPPSPPPPPAHRYSESGSPYHDASPPHPAEPSDTPTHQGLYSLHSLSRPGSRTTSKPGDSSQAAVPERDSPAPPVHASGTTTRRLEASTSRGDVMDDPVSGAAPGTEYGVADRYARENGLQALRSAGQVPPPPSRNQYQAVPQNVFSGVSSGKFRTYDDYASSSPSRSFASLPDSRFGGDPYQGYSNARGNGNPMLGLVNPHDIEDDGDDGLQYPRHSQRDSVRSFSNSERGARQAAGTSGGLGVMSREATEAFLGRNGRGKGGMTELYARDGPEDSSDWMAKRKGRSRRWKRWLMICLVFLLVAGGMLGGIIGGVVSQTGHKSSGKSSRSLARQI